MRAGKVPVHIGMRDGRPFGLAGLYERWLSPDGAVLDTCTIVTTAACESLHDVHERMPVIVADEDHARWLDCANAGAGDLLATWAGDALRVYPVSTRVNAVRNDDAGLVEPVASDRPTVSDAGTEARASNERKSHDAYAAQPTEAEADVPDQLSLL